MVKTTPFALAGQALLYGLFALIIGYFSTSPSYRHMEPDQALVKLSFSHYSQRVGECRQRTAEELAKLAPNMRAPMSCPRERSPVKVEVDLDGNPLYRNVITPAGLSKDSAATVYQRLPVKAGEHRLSVRLNDSAKVQGFNFTRDEKVTLKPAQVLVIDFVGEKGGIVFQ